LAGAPAVVAVTSAGGTAAMALVAVAAMVATTHPQTSRPHALRTEDLP
jgi:gamma-glutamyltranspeptidase